MPDIPVSYAKYVANHNDRPIIRLILVVDGMPFYRSSGINSGSMLAGTFLPFLGIESNGENSGWFRKPGSMDILDEASREPLQEVFAEFNFFPKDLDDLLVRFASVKCLLISSLLDEAMQREETPPPSFLSTPFISPGEESFWRRLPGINIKTNLREKFPQFYQDRQYQLFFNKLIVDIRGTARHSYKQRTLFGQLDSFLEKQVQKPLMTDFEPKEFKENLEKLDMTISLAPNSYFYLMPPGAKVRLPRVKKAKEMMQTMLEHSEGTVITPESFTYRQPVKYNEFVWPEDLASLGINEEKRLETEKFITISYNLYFENFFNDHKKLIDENMFSCWCDDQGSEHIDPDSGQTLICHLSVKYLHNGQIVLIPRDNEVIYKKVERKLEIFKVYNLVTGEWMVLKSSAPKQLYAELISLSGKDGIVQFCDFTLDTWTTTWYNSYNEVTRKERFQIRSIIENYYPQHFVERLKDAERGLTVHQKARYILSLLKGLASIHALTASVEASGSVAIPVFHGDIKLENIMFDSLTDQPRLIDFDCFGDWHILVGSNGWYAPESSKFMSSLDAPCMTREDIWQFNRDYGQAMDLWNMALVFATILTKPVSNAYFVSTCFYPPFSFLHNRLNGRNQAARYHQDMMQLTQKEIDAEMEHFLQQLPDNEEGRILFSLWAVVIAMLKVDADKREPAAHLVRVLEAWINCGFEQDHACIPEASEVLCSSQMNSQSASQSFL